MRACDACVVAARCSAVRAARLQQCQHAVVVLGDMHRKLGHVRATSSRFAQPEIAGGIPEQVAQLCPAELEPAHVQLQRAACARGLAQSLEELLGEAWRGTPLLGGRGVQAG